MKRLKEIPLVAWLVLASLLLHAAGVVVAERSKLLGGNSQIKDPLPLDLTLDASAEDAGGVLTQIKDKNKDADRELKSPLISEQNRKSVGRMTKAEGYNMQAPSASAVPGAGLVSKEKPAEEGETEAAVAKTYSGGGELTENLNEMRFNFSEGMTLRVGSRENKNAGFYNSVVQSVAAVLKQFIKASPFQNYALVSADQSSCLVSVSRSGKITFIKMLQGSTRQPVLNHYLEESVKYAADSDFPPAELLGLNRDSIELSFTVASSGPPTGSWWLSISPLK